MWRLARGDSRYLPAGFTAWPPAGRLKSGGVLTLIWRADGIAEVLAALDRGFGSLAVLPVHGEPSAPAIRVIIRAIKEAGHAARPDFMPELMLNDESACAE